MKGITVLVPCKDQKREFFFDALGSLVRQTSPDWEALILTDPASPPEIAAWTESFADPRLRVCPCPEPGFARALNFGSGQASTPFVSILLSDDRYVPEAIATLDGYRNRHPEADFFHSARRLITATGAHFGGILPARPAFTLEDFRRGSPVKHLLCWRRERALAIGGMDESLSVHGCDDFDFPWRMAESGATFQAVEECLYEYRIHHAHDRLTTTVPLERQIATLRTMFAKHGVPPEVTDRNAQRAIGGYFIKEFTDQIDNARGALAYVRCFRQADASAAADFRRAGFRQRHFFPHRVFALPKGGPDGFKLARRMAGATSPSRMTELALYALPPLDTAFPEELYFDYDIQWHQQQFGLRGQIACANILREENAWRCYLMISDLVQRIARSPQHRTRVDNSFKGWARILLNAVLVHARENRCGTVYVAGSELVLRNTDPKRSPKAPLYQRIYDVPAQELGAESAPGGWWRIDLDRIEHRIAPLARMVEADRLPKTVCLLHDTERGLGHRTADSGLAARADREAGEALQRMLAIEAARGVKSTYSVVGTLFRELRGPIEAGGHALGFHSYDHTLPGDPDAIPDADGSEQLLQCRRVDYRIKGYRPPQSKILPGLSDENLAEHNFEWLATSAHSIRRSDPFVENAIVKIPVHLDDYPMHSTALSYRAWEARILDLLAEREFAVIGLHDCYAHHWLDHYEELLGKIGAQARFMTLDEVAARITLGHSRWFLEE